ncbi:MAG: hypothetical protein AB7F75_10100 [Planctomycetota bacterium]
MIRTVAVCPVQVMTGEDAHGYPLRLDGRALGRLLAEEWTKFGVLVSFPEDCERVLYEHEILVDGPEALQRMGRLMKVDAVCLVQIHQMDTFSPKRCLLTLHFYKTDRKDFKGPSIVNITSMGWDKVEETGMVELARIQRQWDGSDDKTRNRAIAWHKRQAAKEETGWTEIVEVTDEFFRFVFNATLRDYVTELQEMIDEADKIHILKTGEKPKKSGIVPSGDGFSKPTSTPPRDPCPPTPGP